MLDRMTVTDPRTVPDIRRPARKPEPGIRDRTTEPGIRDRDPVPRTVEPPLTFRDRSELALADVGIHRLVPFRELVPTRFNGKARAARRAVNGWIHQGLATEFTARDGDGADTTVLALTREGAAVARELALTHGVDPGQSFTHVTPRGRRFLAHDMATYRACRRERARLEREGARVRRLRLESELRGAVHRRSQQARREAGRMAAAAERRRAAGEFGLPVDPHGHVTYPDVQIEYVDAEGRTGRVNIEITSGSYPLMQVRAKAAAGFRLHANGARAARVLAKARNGAIEL